jgi:hypothetical protein
VPFRTIRAEYFVLLTLPLIASLNPIILVEGSRRNLLRLWLRTKIRVLRFDLLNLLRIGLGPAPLLAGAFCWPVAATVGAALAGVAAVAGVALGEAAVAAAGVALTAPVAAAGVVAGVADVFAARPFIPFLGCSAPGVPPPAA